MDPKEVVNFPYKMMFPLVSNPDSFCDTTSAFTPWRTNMPLRNTIIPPPCLALKSLGFFFPEETSSCWVHSQHLEPKSFNTRIKDGTWGGKGHIHVAQKFGCFKKIGWWPVFFPSRSTPPSFTIQTIKKSLLSDWALTKTTYNMDLIELKLLIRPLLSTIKIRKKSLRKQKIPWIWYSHFPCFTSLGCRSWALKKLSRNSWCISQWFSSNSLQHQPLWDIQLPSESTSVSSSRRVASMILTVGKAKWWFHGDVFFCTFSAEGSVKLATKNKSKENGQ